MQPGRGLAEGLAADLVMDDASDPEQARSIELLGLLVSGKVEHELFERRPDLFDRCVSFDGPREVSEKGLRVAAVARIGCEWQRLLEEDLRADGISIDSFFAKRDARKRPGVVPSCKSAISLCSNVGQPLAKKACVIAPACASEKVRVAYQSYLSSSDPFWLPLALVFKDCFQQRVWRRKDFSTFDENCGVPSRHVHSSEGSQIE